jgi:hypothetical protein
MNLFNSERVKDFFTLLSSFGRSVESRYSAQYESCEKQVFVKRALKPLCGYYKIVRKDGFGNLYWQYICVVRIEYALHWRDQIHVYYLDASKMLKNKKEYGLGCGNFLDRFNFSHNDVLNLEGQKISKEEYHMVRELFKINLPEKQYKFKAYLIKKGSVENTSVTVSAKLRSEAWKKAKEYKTDTLVITNELIK